MLSLSRIFCTAGLVALLISPIVFAQQTRGIKFEANGWEVIGWVPYVTGKVVSMPPIKLPNGEMTMDFPSTIVNFPNSDKSHDFTLSIAADPKIDHSKLQLFARDAKDLIVKDFTFSVSSTPGPTSQLITFVCNVKGDPNLIKQLVVARKTAVAPAKEA